jgi:hypothetical protein
MNESAKHIGNRLRNCSGRDAKAREALSILLEATGARDGHLFCFAGARLQHVASIGSAQDARTMLPALESMLKHEFASNMISTVITNATLPPRADEQLGGAEPLVLLGKHAGDTVLAGVAALRYAGDARQTVRRATVEALVHAMIDAKLAEPLACET